MTTRLAGVKFNCMTAIQGAYQSYCLFYHGMEEWKYWPWRAEHQSMPPYPHEGWLSLPSPPPVIKSSFLCMNWFLNPYSR